MPISPDTLRLKNDNFRSQSVGFVSKNDQEEAGEEQSRIPTAIVLVDSTGYGEAHAVILRRPNGVFKDVIVLDRTSVSHNYLLAAITMLQAARDLAGDTSATNQVLRVRNQQLGLSYSDAERARAAAVIGRLIKSPEREIPGFGRGRVTQIWLQNKKNRGNHVKPSPAHDNLSPTEDELTSAFSVLGIPSAEIVRRLSTATSSRPWLTDFRVFVALSLVSPRWNAEATRFLAEAPQNEVARFEHLRDSIQSGKGL